MADVESDVPENPQQRRPSIPDVRTQGFRVADVPGNSQRGRRVQPRAAALPARLACCAGAMRTAGENPRDRPSIPEIVHLSMIC